MCHPPTGEPGLGHMAAGQLQEPLWKCTGPPETQAGNENTVTSATFYWPKQVPGQPGVRGEEMDSFYTATHHKGVRV